jgi:hypothetical protein
MSPGLRLVPALIKLRKESLLYSLPVILRIECHLMYHDHMYKTPLPPGISSAQLRVSTELDNNQESTE